MAQMIENKCPCCGGAVEFDSTIQRVKCPYCDTEFDVEALRSYEEDAAHMGADEMDWETRAGGEWQEGETEGMVVYICKSCGGEIVGDQNVGATTCPYCGNHVVMKGQFAGDLRPDYVIPFKLDKNAAKEALRNHMKRKHLLPKRFKDENHLDEIKGIYVPFWLFDAHAEGTMRYKGTRLREWSDGDYIYTETSFYSIVRGGNVDFERVPVDGSTRMPDDLMESIEPFDFSEAVDFHTAYLAGYLADRYDVDEKASVERANARIKKSTEQMLESSTSGMYATIIPEGGNISLKQGKAKYALYPVWMLTTSWKGENYLFAMNGQTGKFVGNLPVDKGAFWRWYGIWAAAFAVIVHIIRLILG